MVNESLIEKLKTGVWHQAQDTEFDTGFNCAKALAIEIIRQHESSLTLSEPQGKEEGVSLPSTLIDCVDAKAFARTMHDNLPYDRDFYTKEAKRIHAFVSYYESCKASRCEIPGDEIERVARAIYHLDVNYHPYAPEYIEEIFKAFRERYDGLAKAAISAMSLKREVVKLNTDDVESAAEYAGIEPERLFAAMKYYNERAEYLKRTKIEGGAS
jgi:hypothetical protein